MKNLDKLTDQLNAEDWKAAYIAIRMQMVRAIEKSSDVDKSSVYYENLSKKLHEIWFEVNKKEKDYE